MSGGLVDAMHAVDPEVTGVELADAVWLVEAVAPRLAEAAPDTPDQARDAAADASGDRSGGPSADVMETPPADHDAPPPGWGASEGPPNVSRVPEPSLRPGESIPSTGAGDERQATWHPPAHGRVLDPPGWLPARSPGADALPGVLATSRALRPLHRRVPSRTAARLDEEATVRLAVEQGLLLPVQEPVADRWLDMVLVVDVSASMALWRRQVDGLRAMLEQLGAFRDLRWYLFDGDRAGDRLVLRSPGGSATHDPAELVDPTGRRAVLVVSDGVGAAWSGTGLSEALRTWAVAGPVALVQMLPQRLWASCRPRVVGVRLHAVRHGAANADLDVVTHPGVQPWPRGAVPVPVLELQPRWLRPWASLVAHPGSDPLPFTVLPVGGVPVTRDERNGRPASRDAVPDEPLLLGPEPADRARRGDPSAEDLLTAFRAQASLEALTLAERLSAAPLRLPVMRLVQQATLPRSQPSVLAEIFLSGLLERPPEVRPAADPEDIDFDFVPGVRDLLLEGLPRHEQLAVLGEVSRFIAQRLGSPNDFPAFLAGENDNSEIVGDRAFARVALRVLRGLGGRYAEVATRLARLAGSSLADDVTPLSPAFHETDDEMPPLEPSGGRTGGATAVRPQPAPTRAPHDVAPHSAVDPVPRRDPRLDLASPPQRIFGGVPLRNAHFTGRVELLDRLHAMLRSGVTQTALLPHALHGMGGVGKTQIAIEYAHRYAAEYDLVWWLRADSLTTLRQGLAELADVMDLLPEGDLSRRIRSVLDVLQDRRAYPRWLVVFDNANTPGEVEAYLPQFGNVLVTSRNPDWAQVADQVSVDVFARDESIALLQRRGAEILTAEANVLAARLGDLPLALDQAAAWQAATGTPAVELDRMLAARMAALMSEPPPANYPASLMATWDLAFTALDQRSPGAARLLELLAYFGPDPIAIPLLLDGRNADLAEPLRSTLQDEIRLRRAIREIGRYALAKPNAGRDEVEIHRLVQAVLRERLTPEQRTATQDAVHRVIGAANPSFPDYKRTWARHAELLPHISPSGVIQGTSDAGHRAALDQIRYRWVVGDYERSEYLGDIAVKAWRTALGPDHELTLLAQRHLGLALVDRGRYAEAAELNRQTLERMRAVFGDDHEHTLSAMMNVGRDLRIAGRYREAWALDEENLGRRRRLFGTDDPQTLRAMNNAAASLRFLGRAQEAEDLDQACLEQRQLLLGPENVSVAFSTYNLARDLADAGRYAEAETLLVEARPRVERLLRSGHFAVLAFRSTLAITWRRSGRAAPARQLAEEVYEASRSNLSEGHEFQFSAAVTYANALLAVGETSGAKLLAEQAWQGYRRIFGSDHPSTIVAALDLAVVLRATGDRPRAMDLDRYALTALTGWLGEEHPYVLVAMINLAHDHALASETGPARELSGRAYERSLEIRGDRRPETLVCGLNHALDLRATGDTEAATELLDRVRSVITEDYGRYGEDFPLARAAAQERRAEADIEHWET